MLRIGNENRLVLFFCLFFVFSKNGAKETGYSHAKYDVEPLSNTIHKNY